MTSPNTGRRNAVLLAVLLSFNLLLMTGSARGSRGSAALESGTMRLTSPFVGLARYAADGTIGVLRGATGLILARARGMQLESDVQHLGQEVARLREVERENERLRRLLAMRDHLVPESIVAAVVMARFDGRARMIVVDRGTKDGVERDLPVVGWGGAVGRVVFAERSYSKVRLLTDADSGVAGVVQRSRVPGIVVGRARDGLDLKYVPRFSDVMHDDRVVTSGLDGIFPRGFGIGRVTAITEAADGTQTVHLTSEVDYRLLEEVLIVLESVAASTRTSGGDAE